MQEKIGGQNSSRIPIQLAENPSLANVWLVFFSIKHYYTLPSSRELFELIKPPVLQAGQPLTRPIVTWRNSEQKDAGIVIMIPVDATYPGALPAPAIFWLMEELNKHREVFIRRGDVFIFEEDPREYFPA